ncbi:hypothetical protein OIU84_007313 [Salix udensis]|uniref:Uncharacterized protein n=1 Tax=Salix udensis TaxID=889485 RepID=A0AAD6JUN3_9ROSI|nr:hypothetical protein OIU84_007313 [Salix udensis]
MREAERVSPRLAIVLLLAFISFNQLFAEDDTILYESFDNSFDGRWIVSEKEGYNGEWKHEKSEGHDDYGLLVSEPARKYAIVKELDEPASLKDGTVVLQFETRLQKGLECGGAYLKYLRPQEAGIRTLKSGEYVEHHLKFPPSVPHDKLTHVYTAILKPDNELQILVDGDEKKKANFLSSEDFEMAYLFDNILIARDEKVASSIRDTTWKPKFDIEKEKEKADEAPAGADVLGGFQKKVFELLYQVAELSFLSEHKDKITELIEKAEKQPIITIGVLVSIVVVILTVFLKLIFGGKKAKVEKKPEPVAETSNKEGSGDEKAEEKEEPAAPVRKRQTRREN